MSALSGRTVSGLDRSASWGVGHDPLACDTVLFCFVANLVSFRSARGCPGAHVLIQQRRGSPPVTDACLQFAADLAIFYSDARSEKTFDVTTTEPKHLLKPRSAPLGAVKLRQESSTLVGRPEHVPEECKQARDASGQDAEYRFQDKAKHRRRTSEAAKKQRDKRRASKK